MFFSPAVGNIRATRHNKHRLMTKALGPLFTSSVITRKIRTIIRAVNLPHFITTSLENKNTVYYSVPARIYSMVNIPLRCCLLNDCSVTLVLDCF